MPFPLLTCRSVCLALVCTMVLLAACKPSEPPISTTCFTTLVHSASICEASSDDYHPRNHLGSWGNDSCTINNNPNEYRAINPTDISTKTRIAAFEEMGSFLWNHPRPLSAENFTQARLIYSRDEGLDSRVQRRENIHFPVLPDCQRCNLASDAVQKENADRCAGPVHIVPIVNEAFEKGFHGQSPLLQAQRIEAALLWFNYLSALSEVQTCANEPKNCDSAWAYYTGGTSRDNPLGLAAYVNRLNPEIHEQAYDAALAVRCWRDLDQAVPASNTDLQYRALKQFDKALSRGMALILQDKVVQWQRAVDEENSRALQAFVQTLFGLMENNLLAFVDSGALQQSPEQVHTLKTLVNSPSPTFESMGEIKELLGSLFPCL